MITPKMDPTNIIYDSIFKNVYKIKMYIIDMYLNNYH